MLLPPSSRLAVKKVLEMTRLAYEAIVLVNVDTTDCTTCGYDRFTDSGLDPVCPTCRGLGRIATFVIHELYARWNVIELPSVNPFEGIPPGVESGDYLVWVSKRDYDLALLAQDEAYSYVEISGQTFKFQGVSPEGIGHSDEYRFIAKKYKPVFARP
jgi:hypothetical protein